MHHGRVLLEWDSASIGLFHKPDGYRVYRAGSEHGHFHPVGTVDGDVTAAADEPEEGEWCYRVTAFRGPKHRQSGPTDPACARVGRGDEGRHHMDCVVPMAELGVLCRVTPTPTPLPDSGILLHGAVAAPNMTDGTRPVRLMVTLGRPSRVELYILNTACEMVHRETAQGFVGVNTLVWEAKNKSRQAVASGIYSYVVRAWDGREMSYRRGKILIIH